MAVTYAFTPSAGTPSTVWGNKRVVFGQLVATGTYTTGGDSITAAQFGLKTIDELILIPDGSGANTNGQAVAAPNLTTLKIKLFGSNSVSGSTLPELTAATTVTGMTWQAVAIGD